MNIKINSPNDKDMLENRMAYIRAIFMQKYIDDLKLSKKEKLIVKDELLKKLNE